MGARSTGKLGSWRLSRSKEEADLRPKGSRRINQDPKTRGSCHMESARVAGYFGTRGHSDKNRCSNLSALPAAESGKIPELRRVIVAAESP